MKHTALATAVAVASMLTTMPASAQSRTAVASKAEVAAMQTQMQGMLERLDRLESANQSLQAENAQLKEVVELRDAETDYLKEQTKELREVSAVASNEISKVKGADWATRLKGRGDLRYRHEQISTERVIGSGATAQVDDAADRARHRIRARLGFDAQVTDNVKTTLLFATGADDPRSSNQTLGSASTRKSIGVDMAYADWTVKPGINAVLGKQPWPFWRPGNSLFYDGDYNPEGGALKYDRGMLFGSAYGWWLEERYNADPAAENADSNVFGLQAGLKVPLFGQEARVAAHYYECGACQGNSPLFNNGANGNSTFRIGTSTTNNLTYGYDILELSAEVNALVANLPLQFWANYAQNMANDVEYDSAYAVGVAYGRASNPRTWNAGLWYQSIDKDALFGQFVDSDFGDGRTDSEGWVLRGAYAPVRNLNIQATYFMNTLNKDVAPVSGATYRIGEELDYDRLQLDVNYKF